LAEGHAPEKKKYRIEEALFWRICQTEQLLVVQKLKLCSFFFNFVHHIGPAWVRLKKKYKKTFLKGETHVFEGEKRVFFLLFFLC